MDGTICYNVDLQKEKDLLKDLLHVKQNISELEKKLQKLINRQGCLTQQLHIEKSKNSFTKTHLQLLKVAQKHLV